MLGTDRSGMQTWKAISEAFGDMRVDTGSAITMNLRFAGQYFDGESGLHQNYFCDYRPGTGRYVQRDPIGLAGGINTFVYVGGNPLVSIDPDGLSKMDPFYGLPRSFWNWLHGLDGGKYIQAIKEGKNVPEDVARAHHQEWVQMQKPNPRGNQNGIVDPGILEILLPWYLTSSPLAPAVLYGPGTPYPTYEDFVRSRKPMVDCF